MPGSRDRAGEVRDCRRRTITRLLPGAPIWTGRALALTIERESDIRPDQRARIGLPMWRSPMRTQRNRYTAYSIGCAGVWGVILLLGRRRLDSQTWSTLRLVCSGWWMGWTSATIARIGYPPPKQLTPAGKTRLRTIAIVLVALGLTSTFRSWPPASDRQQARPAPEPSRQEPSRSSARQTHQRDDPRHRARPAPPRLPLAPNPRVCSARNDTRA